MAQIQLPLPELDLAHKAISLNFLPEPLMGADAAGAPALLKPRSIGDYGAAAEKAAAKAAVPAIKIQVNFANLFAEPAAPAQAAKWSMIDTGAEEAEELPFKFCDKQLACGHRCKGVQGERKCLPCIEESCAERSGLKAGINAAELCTTCYTSELSAEPCVQLSCGHVFHVNCVVQILTHRWSTLRITWSFMACPACKTEIDVFSCRPVAELVGPLFSMRAFIRKDCLKQAEKQGLLMDERLTSPDGDYYGKPVEYAMKRCSYYLCNDCQKPYFGGLIDCE